MYNSLQDLQNERLRKPFTFNPFAGSMDDIDTHSISQGHITRHHRRSILRSSSISSSMTFCCTPLPCVAEEGRCSECLS